MQASIFTWHTSILSKVLLYHTEPDSMEYTYCIGPVPIRGKGRINTRYAETSPYQHSNRLDWYEAQYQDGES